MEQKQLTNRIETIAKELSRLADAVRIMSAVDIRLAPESYEEQSTQAALSAEKITCRLRSLIYATARIKKMEYLVLAGEAQGIRISEKDGVLQITMPCLRMKKQSRLGSLFLSDPLYAMLERYTAHRTAPRFRECVVCFCHVYEESLLPHQAPDHDSYLQKQILDVVAAFLLTDDNGWLCDLHNTAEWGEHDCTHIFLMQKECFPAWLAKREKE